MNEPQPTPSPAAETAIHARIRPFRSHRARRWALACVMLAAAWLLISFAVAYRLTQRKRPPFPEPAPAVSWGTLEGLRLTTDDGQQIGGWFAEGRADAPAVLFLHGNKGSRGHCLERAGIVAAEAGCAVMLISMRAHGDSTGDFNDIGYSARHDVVAAVEFLLARRPGRPIVLFGVSLGSAAAAFAAAELGEKVDGYVLESPYQDLKTAVWNRTSTYLPPGLDAIAYVGLRLAGLVLLPNIDAISPLRAVGAIPEDVPVLILAGDADEMATPEEARALFERVRSHARLESFPGATHYNLATVEPDRYKRTIVGFVAQARRDRR
ncbi:alpha/beta hydrolase [Paludisphaera mucosa]|uniref:Alpha/beta fold hydrolase n=1 Tax=Paludisphaera mucosa TaxID=3030827 RepID=A0ABT6FGH1_9BACT|nr:alpha/beta fold hydrolase [Paludisphaera mucosa]MDG3006672.1 alpha/beta fold hydrolase [Paludisphaera mucosa]